jgi:hypothetical protein
MVEATFVLGVASRLSIRLRPGWLWRGRFSQREWLDQFPELVVSQGWCIDGPLILSRLLARPVAG